MAFSRRLVITLPAVAALASCAGMGGPTTVTLTASDIERLVQRRFPIDKRMLEVFDVTMNAPRISLLPERNRVAAVVKVNARSILVRGSWEGQLTLDSALRWEPSDQTVRLNQVRVQDLLIASADPLARSAGERMGAALAERMLEDFALYALPPERAAQMRALGVAPAAVTVTARGVEISFAALGT
jgi:hypothetical protein